MFASFTMVNEAKTCVTGADDWEQVRSARSGIDSFASVIDGVASVIDAMTSEIDAMTSEIASMTGIGKEQFVSSVRITGKGRLRGGLSFSTL